MIIDNLPPLHCCVYVASAFLGDRVAECIDSEAQKPPSNAMQIDLSSAEEEAVYFCMVEADNSERKGSKGDPFLFVSNLLQWSLQYTVVNLERIKLIYHQTEENQLLLHAWCINSERQQGVLGIWASSITFLFIYFTSLGEQDEAYIKS